MNVGHRLRDYTVGPNQTTRTRRWKAITIVLILFQCINSNLVQHVLELVLHALFFLLICALHSRLFTCVAEKLDLFQLERSTGITSIGTYFNSKLVPHAPK